MVVNILLFSFLCPFCSLSLCCALSSSFVRYNMSFDNVVAFFTAQIRRRRQFRSVESSIHSTLLLTTTASMAASVNISHPLFVCTDTLTHTPTHRVIQWNETHFPLLSTIFSHGFFSSVVCHSRFSRPFQCDANEMPWIFRVLCSLCPVISAVAVVDIVLPKWKIFRIELRAIKTKRDVVAMKE